MFEIGEKYTFEMLDTRDDKGNPDVTSFGAEVLAVDGPLIKISGFKESIIINTHSSIFVRATQRN